MTTGTRGNLAFGLAMVLSGTIGFVARGAGLEALPLVFARCLVGAMCLGTYVFLMRVRVGLSDLKAEAPWTVLSGLALVFNWVFLFRSFLTVPITVAVSLYYIAPVLVCLHGFFQSNERGPVLGWLGVAAAFLGTLLVSGLGNFQNLSSKHLLGCLFALVAAVLYATVMVLGRKIQRTPPAVLSLAQTLVGVAVLPIFLIGHVPSLEAVSWLRVSCLGAVHTGVMYILFFYGLRRSTTNAIAVLSFLDPLVAVGIDSIVFQRLLGASEWAGVALIFCGVVAAKVGGR